MDQKKRVWICLLLTGLLTTSLLFAAGGQEGAAEEVTLTCWLTEPTSERNAEGFAQAVEEYQNNNPGIKINISYFPWGELSKKLIAAGVSAALPDVFSISPRDAAGFFVMGFPQPLNDLIDLDVDDFNPGALRYMTYNDKIMTIATEINCRGLFYNKDMLAAKGIAEPPTNWEELLETALALTEDTTGDGNIDTYGFAFDGAQSRSLIYTFAPFLLGNNGSFLNEAWTESSFNSPEAMEALQFFGELYYKWNVSPPGTPDSSRGDMRRLFIASKSALFNSGAWEFGGFKKDAPDLNYGVALFPGNRAKSGVLIGGSMMAVSSQGKQKKAAAKFLHFITNSKNQDILQESFPARTSTTELFDRYGTPGMKKFIEQMKYAHAVPVVEGWSKIEPSLIYAIQSVLLEKATAEEAANKAHQEINAVLGKS
jgi:multiple sugar transport system substrate-binding protein